MNNIIDNIYSLLSTSEIPELKEIINKRCDELKLSQRKLSAIIGIERKSLQRIMDGAAQKIDVVTFVKLGQFLKMEIQELLQIYISKLDPESIKEIENTRKASYILQNFDLEILKRKGFIKNKDNFEEIENRIRDFFKLNSLFEYSQFAQAPYFSRTQRSYSDKMLNFWISLIFHQIKNVENPNRYDRELLKTIIPKIRSITRDEVLGLKRIANSLHESGVTIIFQSYLSKTSIRGATFVYKEKPYIILTDHNKRYDSIWFSLSHELFHILQDFDQIQKLTYHITGESDLFIDSLAEENANEFARELLFPQEKLDYIKNFIDIPDYVEEFAKKHNIHPSIIYGFYLYDKKNNNEYKKYQRFLLNSEVAIKNLLIEPWDKQNVDEIINQIKIIYHR